MKKTIHKLRQQPEEVRRHILRWATLAAALLLFALWVYSLGLNFRDADTEARINNDLEPFSIIRDSITEGIEGMEGGSAYELQ